MPAYYFDTSALAKRYIVEVGSAWVQALVAEQSGQTIYTSVLTQPELEHMTQSYALAAITPFVITQACVLLHRHPLRAYDALHVACALAVREAIAPRQLAELVFVAADAALLTTAATEGSPVANPLQHP
jgi:predicted nucleic acid-binding protein